MPQRDFADLFLLWDWVWICYVSTPFLASCPQNLKTLTGDPPPPAPHSAVQTSQQGNEIKGEGRLGCCSYGSFIWARGLSGPALCLSSDRICGPGWQWNLRRFGGVGIRWWNVSWLESGKHSGDLASAGRLFLELCSLAELRVNEASKTPGAALKDTLTLRFSKWSWKWVFP